MSAVIRFACAALVFFLATPTRAEIVDCIDVKSVGYIITAPGIYCLKDAVSGPYAGVVINANDVVLDLNGHLIELPVGGVAVYGSAVSRVTVRNGTIRGGSTGVSLQNHVNARGGGHLIERLRIEGSASCGICVQGDGVVVRNNVVTGVGSSTIGARAAIHASAGAGMRLSDNLVVDLVVNTGQIDGIVVIDAPGAVIERNVVANATASTAGPLYPMGIHVYRSGSNFLPMRTVVAGNRVVNMRTGILSDTVGVFSLFVDNAVGGSPTPFHGGVMAGTTNYSF